MRCRLEYGRIIDVEPVQTIKIDREQAVERLARENLGLVKPGEIVLLIREPEAEVEADFPDPSPQEPRVTNP